MINKHQKIQYSQEVKHCFDGFRQVINQVHQSLKSKKEKLPIYLIIGSRGVGKTTFVENADLDLNQHFSDGQKHTHAWLSHDAVYIECPSEFIGHTLELPIWVDVAKILQRFKGHSIELLTLISLKELLTMSRVKREAQLVSINHALTYYKTHARSRMRWTLVLTHADTINGFTTFFTNCNDPLATFGVTLPKTSLTVNALEKFHQAYQDFLVDLNKNVIQRLQSVRRAELTAVIRDFPLQMESLQAFLASIIQRLCSANPLLKNYHLANVFFTSSTTDDTTVDRLSDAVTKSFPEAGELQEKKQPKQHSLFTHDILTNHMAQALPPHKAKSIWRIGALATLTSISLAAVIYLAIDFRDQMHSLTLAEEAVQQLEINHHIIKEAKNVEMLLPTLDMLQTAAKTLSKNRLNWLYHRIDKRFYQTTNQLETTYESLLKNQFLPLAFDHTKEVMLNKENKKAERFSAFKVYQALAENKTKDNAFIIQWFNNHWQYRERIAQPIVEALSSHLKNALALNGRNLPFNATLALKLKRDMNQLPKSYLTYVNIKALFSNHRIEPLASVSSFVNTPNQQYIPYLYTVEGHKQFERSIAKLNLSPKLVSEVIPLYHQDYVNWWQNWLNNSHPIALGDLEQAATTFRQFANTTSPFTSIISVVKEQTLPLKDKQDFDKLITFFDTHQSQLQKIFTHIAQALTSTLHSQSQDSVAFEWVRDRYLGQKTADDPLDELLTVAKDAPQPLKRWLSALANNTWYLLLQHAQQHVNAVWQTQIMPFYRTRIANRYPLVSYAKKEISLEDFTKFFGPQGELMQFFSYYVKPFINTEHAIWKPRAKDFLAMNIESEVLQQLQRANIIRTMFFDDVGKLSVNFFIKPAPIDNRSQNSLLAIDDQKIFHYMGSTKVSHLHWPKQASSHLASLKRINASRAKELHEEGAWAMFKLFALAEHETLRDTKHYMLTFNVGNQPLQYQITAEHAINPFIPGIVDNFRAPDEIFRTARIG